MKSGHPLLYQPYFCLEEGLFDVPRETQVKASPDLNFERFVGDFPILDRLLLTNSVVGHYHVLRSMIATFVELSNKDKARKCLYVIKCLIDKMPTYPPAIVEALEDKTVAMLRTNDEGIVSAMIIRNPGFFARVSDPLLQMRRRIGSVLSIRGRETFNMEVQKMCASLDMSRVHLLGEDLAKFVETVFVEDCATDEVFVLVRKLLVVIPDHMLFVDGCKATVALKKLVPYSLATQRDFVGPSAMTTIKLYRFACEVVKNLISVRSMFSLVSFHRLSISGNAAVDALLFAMMRYNRELWSAVLSRDTADNFRIGFASVMCCLLTCVELPLLKEFLKAASNDINGLLYRCVTKAKSTTVRATMVKSMMLLTGTGTSGIAQVYAQWIQPGVTFPRLTLVQLSPLDPAFPALLCAIARDVASDFNFAVDMAQKVMFTGPLCVSLRALKVLGHEIDFPAFVSYCEALIHSVKFIPAVHLMAQSGKCPDKNVQKEIASWKMVVQTALLSESYIIGDDIEVFASHLHILTDEGVLQLLTFVMRVNMAFLRFMVMLTAVPNFAGFLDTRPKFANEFIRHVKLVSQHMKDVKTTAAICISWHNACISVMYEKQLSSAYTVSFITTGAEALVLSWSTNPLHELITRAVSEVVEISALRKHMASALSCATRRPPSIYARMKELDLQLTTQYLSSWTSDIDPVTPATPSFWGPDAWKPQLCGDTA